MTIESATWIDDLDTTYPAGVDFISEGDNHLRLLKTVLQNQFTGLGAVAVSATATELNYADSPNAANKFLKLDGSGRVASAQMHADAAYIDVAQGWTANQTFNDNVKVQVGTGGDGTFYHNGTNTYLDNATGDFYLRSTAHGNQIIVQGEDAGGTNKDLFRADPDGAFTAYHAGTAKFVTESTGCQVTGNMDMTGGFNVGVSDKRLKRFVKKDKPVKFLEMTRSWRIGFYKYNAKGKAVLQNDDQHTHIGMPAQDVKKTCPDLVRVAPGNNNYLNIAHLEVGYVALKCTQELEEKLAREKKARVTAEGRLRKLEDRLAVLEGLCHDLIK